MSTTPTQNPATYLIQLDAFNITKAWVPQKPYTAADYQKAKDNVDGVNAAIDYAVNTLNIKMVKLPEGNYTFTYLNRNMGQGHPYENKTCVLIPSHTTLDISGCKVEMMYDSVNRSPYDTSSDPVYQFNGFVFGFYHAVKAKLTGGEVLGDLYQRDFVSGEDWVESTYGVMHNFGSRYCEVDGVTIRGFMGDNIIIGNYPGTGTSVGTGWDPEFTLGDLLTNGADNTGYVSQNLNNSYKTEFIALPGSEEDNRTLCIITGVGYARIPPFNNGYVSFYWYDSNYNFIGSEVNQILEETKRPKGAKYLRIVTHNESSNDAVKSFGIQVASNPCTNFTIKNCDLSDSHRGGISGGTNHTLIQSCRIYNNGAGWKEAVAVFPDFTRYQINFEDSYCLGMTVENCDIGDGYHGILAGTYNTFVQNSRFYNLASGVVAYAMNLLQINHNKFNNIHMPVWLESSPEYSRRKILFADNYVRGFSGFMAYDPVELRSNYFESGRVDFNAESSVSENHFVDCAISYSQFGLKVCNNIFENKTMKQSYFDLSASSAVVNKNTFKNFMFNINNAPANREIDFIGCTLDNTIVAYNNSTYVKSVNYIDCILKNGTYHFNGCYGSPADSAYPKVNFINSKIYLQNDRVSAYFDAQFSIVGLVGTYNNNPSMFENEVSIKDSIIYLTGDGTATVCNTNVWGYGFTKLTIENVIVKKNAINTATPTFQWYNNIADDTIIVRNGFTIETDIIYVNIADSKFLKNTVAPSQLPKFIGEEYVWFDTLGNVYILKGVNTTNLSTAWVQIN